MKKNIYGSYSVINERSLRDFSSMSSGSFLSNIGIISSLENSSFKLMRRSKSAKNRMQASYPSKSIFFHLLFFKFYLEYTIMEKNEIEKIKLKKLRDLEKENQNLKRVIFKLNENINEIEKKTSKEYMEKKQELNKKMKLASEAEKIFIKKQQMIEKQQKEKEDIWLIEKEKMIKAWQKEKENWLMEKEKILQDQKEKELFWEMEKEKMMRVQKEKELFWEMEKKMMMQAKKNEEGNEGNLYFEKYEEKKSINVVDEGEKLKGEDEK